MVQHIPQSGGGQQPGGPAVVVHVGHRTGCVPDLVVHDGVHEHRHAVLGQDLQGKIFKCEEEKSQPIVNILFVKRKVGTIQFTKFPRNILSEMFYPNNSHLLRRYFVGASSHIDLLVNIHTGDDEEDPGPPGSS